MTASLRGFWTGIRDGLSWLHRHLFLKPYGSVLCTRGATFWFFVVRIAVIVMAAAEAISWGYVGSFLAPSGWLRYVTTGVAASFMFLLVWVVDVSLMTLDTSKAHYDRVLLARKGGSRWLEWLKFGGGLLARTGMAAGTLIVVAPFLAQLILCTRYRSVHQRSRQHRDCG